MDTLQLTASVAGLCESTLTVCLFCLTCVLGVCCQLVELQAARWQLPANTVMYYYPMSAK